MKKKTLQMRILNPLSTEALTKRHLQTVNSYTQLTFELRETFVRRWGNFYQQYFTGIKKNP